MFLIRPLARLVLAAALASGGTASAWALDPAPQPEGAAPARDAVQPRGPHRLGRSIALVRRQAERLGVPPDLAQAVMMLESEGDPTRAGPMGEIGLMQVRLATAMMLGFRGDQAELFDPALNVSYGVAHLAQAWRIAEGDVCRTLVKYRSHYGEERAARFPGACARLGTTLAAMNSPLAEQPALVAQARRAADPKTADAPKPDAKPVAEIAAPTEAPAVAAIDHPPPPARPGPRDTGAEPAPGPKTVAEAPPAAEARPEPTPEIKPAPVAPVAAAVSHPPPPRRPAKLVAAAKPAEKAAPKPATRTAAKPARPETDKPNVTTTGSTQGVTLVAKTRQGGSGKTALTCTAKTCSLEREGKK
ncbi:lytic transglycosylase domain-containing protein [Salinarimonas soli]|uniref:lytic transglycosylase domain-containing protein n=1 Tax=Salinarimonas soli TaxID=1638099 RepID=UPI001661FE2C|nr:lytic transglycosylase domain-containing protein [Salinarimonas soli]